MTERCKFCRETDRLERHHIVPRRFDGSNDEENIVTVCPTCHSKLESLYDKRFYDALGVEKATLEKAECDVDRCTNTTTRRLPLLDTDEELVVCEGHTICSHQWCGDSPKAVVFNIESDGVCLVCERHGRCAYRDCYSNDVRIYDTGWSKPLCFEHFVEVTGE